ncbi:Nucleoid occlusion protein [subsurface metagenome]
MVVDIPLKKINPNPFQSRTGFDENKIRELAESIDSVGLLNPVLVRPNPNNDDSYQLVHGERRLRACKVLDWENIPATVKDLSDEDLIEINLVENIQREDLNPIDEALGFKIALEKLDITKATLGRKIGKDSTYVINRLNLLELPEDIQERLRRLSITPGQAQPLLRYYRKLKEAQEKNTMKVDRVDGFMVGVSRIPQIILSGKKDPVKVIKDVANRIEREGISVKKLRESVRDYEKIIDNKIVREQEKMNKLKISQGQFNEKYYKAIEKGELIIRGDKLEIQSIKTEFSGQEKCFPKYSGQEKDYFSSREKAPLFTEKEWAEITEYAEIKDELWLNEFPEFTRKKESICALEDNTWRRTYDPEYGDFITKNSFGHPLFIKKGWGNWAVVTFNDGEGHRIKRQFFENDWIGFTFIEEAEKTVHPDWFSDTNLRNLKLWKAQKIRASGVYVRREVIKREDIIKTLEQDLIEIKNAKSLSDEEIKEKVIDFLKEKHELIGLKYIVHPFNFREGLVTEKRLPDGSLDEEFYANARVAFYS